MNSFILPFLFLAGCAADTDLVQIGNVFLSDARRSNIKVTRDKPPLWPLPQHTALWNIVPWRRSSGATRTLARSHDGLCVAQQTVHPSEVAAYCSGDISARRGRI